MSIEDSEPRGLNRVNNALDRGLVRQLFERVRNYLICATLLAIGFYEFSQKPGYFLGMNAGDYSGTPIIVLASALFIINTYDGIRTSNRFLKSTTARVAFACVYILFAIRLIELAWKFTMPS